MNRDEKTILAIYKKYYSGKENAITREEFLRTWKNAYSFWGMTDRKFRQIYSKLPICTCDKGGFYPIRKEEIEDYREYLRKKAIPLFERFNRVRDAHPELAKDIVQMELFERVENDR